MCLFGEKQTEAAGAVSKSEIVEVEGACCCGMLVRVWRQESSQRLVRILLPWRRIIRRLRRRQKIEKKISQSLKHQEEEDQGCDGSKGRR